MNINFQGPELSDADTETNAAELPVIIPAAEPAIHIVVETSPMPDHTTANDLTGPHELYATARQRIVRFRSRVRITSGLHHHRNRKTASADEAGLTSSLPIPITQNKRSEGEDSTPLSSSPSSSISAPLRREDDGSSNSPNSRWGPLGQRVSFFRRKSKQGEQQSLIPKRRCSRPRMYVNLDSDSEEDEYSSRPNLKLNREIDDVFGKWPGRIFNRHVIKFPCCLLVSSHRSYSGGGGSWNLF